uniref:Chloride channel CLIC-like protein 1 n=1 Tax=Phallusia mammillata TaxID=59560 RepID=A0A6F9DA12_9ASCI|nr:chloride channel CLIC-like protein 1 [Phallusia mammillata]
MVLMVFLLLLVSVCFGYAWNLNLPFWSGIEIGPTQNLHAPRQMEQLMADHRQQMQLLQTVMERQNSQPVQALPAPTQTVSPSSGLISSLLGRFGLGGGNLPQQPQPPSSASKENNNLPYPAAPDFTQEHSVDAMPDLPPEALTLRRRVNRPPYPTHTEDQESFAAGDGPCVGPSSSAGHSPYVSPGAPPSYEDVDNRSQKSELAMDFRFEGVSDESVSSQTNPQDAETKSSSVVASDLKNSEVEKNDTDDSDIEILSPDSIKVACMDGN